MAKILGGTPATLRLELGAWSGVLVVCAGAVALAHALETWVVGSGDTGLAHWVVLGLAMASGLFVAAGVLRLTTWRLQRDAHSALVGTALLVMGAVCLPLGGFARLFASAENSALVSLGTRAVASVLVMWLVVRGLRATEFGSRAHPEVLLPCLVALVVAVFVVLLALDEAVDEEIALAVPRVALSGVVTLGWALVAARAAMHASRLPWARRAAPLFVGMGAAEVLRALDHGRFDTWTLGGVLVCASMATLAMRSALIDLDHVVRSDEVERLHLSETLNRVSGEADELTIWREQLTHDARNACAGLRAAMDILERYAGQVDPGTTERLRLAAVQEIGHLEHLLDRSSDQPCEPFDASRLARTVGESARALGTRVELRGVDTAVHAVGRSGDLAAVLKNLLVNAQTHAPGSAVTIDLTATEGWVRITCSDDGPGLGEEVAERAFERGFRGGASPGSGLGLYAARELMREQGGDLELGVPAPGATLVLTLPSAPARALPPTLRLVPGQRTASTCVSRTPARPSHAATSALVEAHS